MRLYFNDAVIFSPGPGSGSSRIQKRLSMKATSLIGDARTSSSGDNNLGSRNQKGGEVTVTADVVPDRRINSRPDKTSVKSNKSDTSEVCACKFRLFPLHFATVTTGTVSY